MIKEFQLETTGLGDSPTKIIWLKTNDTLANVLVAGYLSKNLGTQINEISIYQLAAIYTTDAGTVLLQVKFANKLWSLAQPNENVAGLTFTGTLIAGNLVTVNNASGILQDAAVAPAALQLKAVIKAGITATYAGGATSNVFTAAGLAAGWIATATILTSTNSVAVTKAVAGTNNLTITFSADPGAGTTVQWHAFAAAQ